MYPVRTEFTTKKKIVSDWLLFLGLVLSVLVIFHILMKLATTSQLSTNDYDENTQKCFSRLTTLDHSLLQESDPDTLVKEIKKDIIKNHLGPLCGGPYEDMDKEMVRTFFPNVLFDPIGIK